MPPNCDASDGDPLRTAQKLHSHARCKITYEQRGDAAAYAEVFRGITMRMKMFEGDKAVATVEVTSLSQAPLTDDTLFSVPAGFKKVTAQEFQAAQQRAMMEGITKSPGKGGGEDGGE